MSDETPPKQGLEPTIIVVFGITGDLSQRFLLPALYHVLQENLLHEHTVILGLSRQSIGTEDVFAKLGEHVHDIDQSTLDAMHAKTEVMQFDPNVGEDYGKLLERLNDIETEHGLCM